MKIHTTQNLNVSRPNYFSINNVSSDGFRLKNAKENSPVYGEHLPSYNVSFGKRIPFSDKVMSTFEKNVKPIKDFLKGKKGPVDGNVNNFLEQTTKQEVLITAAVSAVLAGVLRPVTLMLMADDDSKKDMAYASAHAVSSAVWGFIVPFLFIKPLANGYNKALDNAHLYLSPRQIKERCPHADITNPANYINGKVGDLDAIGVMKPLKEQLDYTRRNKLFTDIKDICKVAKPVHNSIVSKETYNKYFDEKGNLKTLKNVYIALIDESKAEKLSKKRSIIDRILNRKTAPKYYELDSCTKGILEEAFNIDPATVKDIVNADGTITRDLSKAKIKGTGEAFKLDKKFCFISDWNETEETIPFITGETYEIVEKSLFSWKRKLVKKDVCYLKNGKDHGRGTPVSREMVIANGENEVHNKLGQWLPDIVIAYPRAVATIALLPYVLKNVFHLEKSKKPEPAQSTVTVSVTTTGKEGA